MTRRRTETVVVETPVGPVRGTRADGVLRFKGVPYAAAPVGSARLAAPAATSWERVFDATRTAPTPQRVPLRRSALTDDSHGGPATLNAVITAPESAQDGSLLPVVVWVHGGSYRGGTQNASEHDGAVLARAGVVVVAVSYRLGLDGFGIVEGVPDNRGLLDVVAALTWVRRCVGAFGGDPRNVTLGGVSAGAALVLSVLASPLGDGLAERALAVSPTVLDTTPERAVAARERLARALGVAGDAAGFLSRTDTDAQLAARSAFPLIGDDVSDEDDAVSAIVPFPLLAGGRSLPDGTLTGSCRSAVPLVVGATRYEVDGPHGRVDAARDHWGVDRETIDAWRAAGGREDAFLSDLLFRSVVPALLEDRAAPTWAYDSWDTTSDGRDRHAGDVAAWFGNDRRGDDRHRALLDFVRRGDPGWDHTERLPAVFGAEGVDGTELHRASAVFTEHLRSADRAIQGIATRHQRASV